VKLKVHKPYPRIGCPHCGGVPRTKKFIDGDNVCPLCGKPFHAALFVPPPEVVYVKPIVLHDTGAFFESSGTPAIAPCAKHELNAATGNCERCGNFICALCRTPLNGKEYCPACFERILEEGREDVPAARQRFFAGIAWMLALVGMMPTVGLLLGPAALFCGIKGAREAWSHKMPRTVKTIAILSIVLGALETLLNWAGFFYVIYAAVGSVK